MKIKELAHKKEHRANNYRSINDSLLLITIMFIDGIKKKLETNKFQLFVIIRNYKVYIKIINKKFLTYWKGIKDIIKF